MVCVSLSLFRVFVVLALFKNAISLCVVENNKTSLTRTDNSPAGILKLLRDGKQLIELQEADRDMVAFIGITGSGKTTLVLHVGGENEDLTSVETRPRSKEYIINDKCNRSSSVSRSLESFTLVPNRFVDSETKVTYFDMPGFSDTRPEIAYDIAATYFSKKVLDYAKRIKLVLVVNHSHLKVAEDRGRFTEMVEHVTRLVRNITKFEESIALVATKVANQYDPDAPTDFPYISDDVVIDGIADFLNSARSLYQEQGRNEAVQLINILVNKTEGEFKRIGLFRRPDGPGPLNSVKSLKQSKKKLKAVIDQHLVFTKKDTDDFGYTLSEKSKNVLHKLIEEVQKNATNIIRVLGSRILAHYISRENSATDLEEIISIFNASAIKVAGFQRIHNFVDYLVKYAQVIGVHISENDTKVLTDNENSLNFLNKINGKEDIDWSWTIQDGMRDVTEYIQSSQIWYISFLNEMDWVLSGYEIQRMRSKYNISSKAVMDQVNQFTSTNDTINSTQLTTLAQFLRETGSESLFPMPTRATNLNKRKLLLLKNILNATLNYPQTVISCQGNKLTIKGVYVILSQVRDKLSACSELQFIEIMALEKIFIDTNFNIAGSGIQLSIIAPVWVITGQIEITLNGKDADPLYEPVAPNGSPWLQNGPHGISGLPGGPAGHFIGIGIEIINGDDMTISAIGGAGGDGQHGGHGYQGKDGVTAMSYTGSSITYAFDVLWAGHSHSNGYNAYRSGFWRSMGHFLGVAADKKVDVYYIYSIPAQRGGNGGNGGSNGIGGQSGRIMLVDSFRNSSIKCVSRNGINGMSGRAGHGAEGGRPGRTLVESYTTQEYWWSGTERILNYEGYEDESSSHAPSGNDGIDGAVVSFMSRKTASTYTSFVLPDSKIYKGFADGNIDYCLHKKQFSKLRNILNQVVDLRAC